VLEFAGADLRVEAANAHSAAVGIAQAFEDFDGSGFAGAIGAEQAKDFAFVNAEADAAHGLHVAVMFHEIVYLQNGFGHKA
jgi:hypothetical protein